jgi:hypothetical protein
VVAASDNPRPEPASSEGAEPNEGLSAELSVDQAADTNDPKNRRGGPDVTPFIGPGLMRVGSRGHAATPC